MNDVPVIAVYDQHVSCMRCHQGSNQWNVPATQIWLSSVLLIQHWLTNA